MEASWNGNLEEGADKCAGGSAVDSSVARGAVANDSADAASQEVRVRATVANNGVDAVSREARGGSSACNENLTCDNPCSFIVEQ